jgi:hypothetical protein
MKELAEGGLPTSGSEVVIWYDEEEDAVVLQLDYIDINLYAADFARLVDMMNQARLNLEEDAEQH